MLYYIIKAIQTIISDAIFRIIVMKGEFLFLLTRKLGMVNHSKQFDVT
jgi:hypothetical protein